MSVIHIIPKAFSYFDDIAESAFAITEGLEEAGVDVDVITLQYTTPTRQEKLAVAEVAPSREYVGAEPVYEAAKALPSYQIVHLHCPFYGAGRDWLNWKKNNPDSPLVVTYYHDLPFSDLFSFYLKFYNRYYLPKFFQIADVVTCVSLTQFKKTVGRRYLKDEQKLFPLLTKECDKALSQSIHLTRHTDNVQLLSSQSNYTSAVGTLIGVYSGLLGMEIEQFLKSV